MPETTAAPDPDAPPDRNQVRLTGRITSPPERRTLPSGDELVVVRVTLRRPDEGADTVRVTVGPGPAPGRRPRRGQVGRRQLAAVAALTVGDRVEVEGRLARRWWDANGTRRSLVEVRADRLKSERSPATP